MLSRLLGLVRDVLMAGFFATGAVSSAFYFAFMVPNLFRRLFGEGALSAAFVPVFVETKEREGEAQAWELATKIVTLLCLTLLSIIVVTEIGLALALRFATLTDRVQLVLELVQIMLPYTFFICLVALSMGILNSFRHFAVPAASPCILNLVWIGAIVLLSPSVAGSHPSVKGLACAIVIAGFLQLLVQFPVLKTYGFPFRFSTDCWDPKVKRVIFLMLPAALGAAVAQINLLIDRGLAFYVVEYGVAALQFSERLIYLPLGMFATAFGTVLLPTLSKSAETAPEEIRHTVSEALRNLLYIMIPSALGLFFLAQPIVQMIFEWKSFDAESTLYTSRALMCYAPGLFVFSLSKVFVPVFYSLKDVKTPVKVAMICVALNLGMNILFVFTWPEGWKHAGLAFATVLAQACFAIILALLLRSRIGKLDTPTIFKSALRALVAGLVMGISCAYLVTPLSNLFGFLPGKLDLILGVLITIGIGLVIYIGITVLLGSREPRELAQTLRRKRS